MVKIADEAALALPDQPIGDVYGAKKGRKVPRALVLSGNGINCEYEMAHAFKLAGAKPYIIHMADVLDRRVKLKNYQIMAWPGGFSFGDDLGSGKVWANKFKSKRYGLQDDLQDFVEDGNLIIGICNGFQALVKLGLLPALDGKYHEQQVTLTYNDSGRFENRWVELECMPSRRCAWTRELQPRLAQFGIRSRNGDRTVEWSEEFIAQSGGPILKMPVRHGEGKFVPANGEILKRLYENEQVVFRYMQHKWEIDYKHGGRRAIEEKTGADVEYPFNPNGSVDGIAGICDGTGRVLGMMPHPEAALYRINEPDWTFHKDNDKRRGGEMPERGDGLSIFESAVSYFRQEI